MLKKLVDVCNSKKLWIIGFVSIFVCLNYSIFLYTNTDFLYKSEMPAENGSFCTLNSGEFIHQYFIVPKDSFRGLIIPTVISDTISTDDPISINIYKNNGLIYAVSTNASAFSSKNNRLLFDQDILATSEDVFLLELINESGSTIEIPVTSTYSGDSSLQKQNSVINNQAICLQFIYYQVNASFLIPALGICLIVGLGLCIICASKKIPLEKTFLILGGYLAIFYFLTLPVFRAPDEINHFMRAFEITQGNIISKHIGETGVGGNYLPSDLIPPELCDARKINYYKAYEARDISMDKSTLYEYTFGNTALYAPLVYLPQTVGIGIAHIFTEKSFYLVYTGRLFTFLFCYILLFFTIKQMPFKKNITFIICFFPMLLSQIVSLSADAVTLSVAFCLFSICLQINKSEKNMSHLQMTILFALSIILSLCKIVYLPLCFIILTIKREKFKTSKSCTIFKLFTLLCVLIANTIWLSISSGFLVEFNLGVDSFSQVKYVLSHPFNYLSVCVNTTLLNGYFWIQTMIGSHLGWAMDIEVPMILILSLLIIWLFFAFTVDDLDQESINTISVKQKIGLSLILLSIIALIYTSLYVQWTPVANNLINGIQGRYFIPLMPVVGVLLGNSKIKVKHNYGILYIILFSINMCAIIKQIFFYL